MNPLLLRIAAFVAFAAWLPASALSAQAGRGAEPPVASVEAGGQPLSVGLVNQAPAAFDGSALDAEGTVVRTSRRSLDGVEHRTFLLRDAAGDTISVRDVEALPAVGARVRVAGVVAARPDGGVELAGGTGGLRLTVLESPEPPHADGAAGNTPAFAEDPCLASPGVFRSIACSMASLPLAVPLGAGILLVIGVATLLLMRRQQPDDESPIPLIVDLNRARMSGEENGGEDASPPLAPAAPVARPTPAVTARAPVPAEQSTSPAASPAHSLAENGRLAVPALVGDHSHARPLPPVADPGDGMLQMLPGRLEVLEGDAIDPEIRFFRVSSLDVPEITFGRFEGPPYRHIQLAAPTVSRLHARIRFADRRWRLTNLSQMNPVVVNDQQMGGEDDELVLADGDRVVIGSFVFRFHGPRS